MADLIDSSCVVCNDRIFGPQICGRCNRKENSNYREYLTIQLKYHKLNSENNQKRIQIEREYRINSRILNKKAEISRIQRELEEQKQMTQDSLNSLSSGLNISKYI